MLDPIIPDQNTKGCDGCRGPLGDWAQSTDTNGNAAYSQPIIAHDIKVNTISRALMMLIVTSCLYRLDMMRAEA